MVYKHMRITFRLASEDYYEAAQARSANNRRVSEVAFLAMVGALSVVWIRAPNARGGHSYALLGFVLLALLALIPVSRLLAKLSFTNTWKNAADPGKDFTVDISEHGIQSLDPTQKDEWSRFSKYSESVNSFILYKDGSVYAILPKRAFDPESINSFRRILKAKLPKH